MSAALDWTGRQEQASKAADRHTGAILITRSEPSLQALKHEFETGLFHFGAHRHQQARLAFTCAFILYYHRLCGLQQQASIAFEIDNTSTFTEFRAAFSICPMTICRAFARSERRIDCQSSKEFNTSHQDTLCSAPCAQASPRTCFEGCEIDAPLSANSTNEMAALHTTRCALVRHPALAYSEPLEI